MKESGGSVFPITCVGVSPLLLILVLPFCFTLQHLFISRLRTIRFLPFRCSKALIMSINTLQRILRLLGSAYGQMSFLSL
ncbi:cobalt transport protein [Ktedonobacter racemifer DSM 44963]|uniref:Cobalt transport protein n=1 Tax=Ktedonobacter racemifer DSM 44963 TaxID=485913 RepID=D6U770_KTERA|nr:cobalt transport protein [Ktedonobacter racemifer DSM 44963]